ncbi:MAG TPA: RNA polymerase sigma-70 factor [Gemmatimonadaceae bacterium]
MTLPYAAPLDTELIARIRAGDESAFERLFHRYYRELCVFASRIDRAGGAAEEIVQEVFFRIWTRREQLLPVESLSGYLYAAVRNVALNRLARAKTEDRWRASSQLDALDARAEAPAADADIRETEMSIAIHRAIGQLPPRCREAFLLRRQRQLSYAEIAQVMGTSPKTVEIQIGKALRLLRQSLAEWL